MTSIQNWIRAVPQPSLYGNLYYLSPPARYCRPATREEYLTARNHPRGVVLVKINGVLRSFVVADAELDQPDEPWAVDFGGEA